MEEETKAMDKDKSFREKALELIVLRVRDTDMANNPVGAISNIALVLALIAGSGMAVVGEMDGGLLIAGVTVVLSILIGKYGISLKRSVDDFSEGRSFGLF